MKTSKTYFVYITERKNFDSCYKLYHRFCSTYDTKDPELNSG